MNIEDMIQSKREELLNEYAALDAPVVVNTLPYHSTKSVLWTIKDHDATAGVAWAVAEPQIVTFLDYGVGRSIALGANAQHTANEADTNMARGKSTNGAADCVIEGLSLGAVGLRIQYDSEVHSEFDSIGPDASITRALSGLCAVRDPSALLVPPEFDSPANLEDSPAQLLIKHAALELEWDRRRTEKLGNCSQYPEGAANSYLKANGQPRVDNLWAIPEGYRWNRDGQPDSELLARIVIPEQVVLPIHTILPNSGETRRAPEYIWTDLCLRVHVFSCALPSGN